MTATLLGHQIFILQGLGRTKGTILCILLANILPSYRYLGRSNHLWPIRRKAGELNPLSCIPSLCVEIRRLQLVESLNLCGRGVLLSPRVNVFVLAVAEEKKES